MKKIVCLLILCLFCFLIPGTSLRTGAIAVNETFNYAFEAGKNPTSDGFWLYEWCAEESKTFAEMDWNPANYFEAQFTTASASDTHWYCRVRNNGNSMHPGAKADAVKTFICPEDGTVEFHITAVREAEITGTHNGNSVRLYQNETKVWPADQDYAELKDKTPLEIKTRISVKKGDKIRFMIGSLGDSVSDGVTVSQHSVKYFSGSSLTPEKNAYTIACIGDSVTEGYTLTGGVKSEACWPSQLQKRLNQTGNGKYTVENYGKTATTAQTKGDIPYVKSAEYAASLKSLPDVVIVSLGANDAKAVNWNASRYKEDYRALIQTYQNLASKPVVYLAYTTYVADQNRTSIQRTVIQDQILKIQYELAQELGLKIIDLNTLTKNNAASYNDGVHPNDALAKKMAEYVYNSLCSEQAVGLKSSNATETLTMIQPEQKIPSIPNLPSNNPGTSDFLFVTAGAALFLSGLVMAIVIILKKLAIRCNSRIL